jgi:hypothetical protein
MVKNLAHTGQLGVCSRRFLRLSDRQKEEREKVENISQKGIQAIVVSSGIIADVVQLCDLLDDGLIKAIHIGKLDKVAAIFLESGESISNTDDSFEDGEFWDDITVNERTETSSENRAHVPSCDTGVVIVQAKEDLTRDGAR